MSHNNPLDDMADMSELVDADIPRVDLVGKAANGTRFLFKKSAADETPNASLFTPEQVRDIITKSEKESSMTDTVAAEDVVKDDLDPTIPLADPAKGEPTVDPLEPGSPAWEAVDAATADKWVGILARARNAIQLLATRENQEAAAGVGDGMVAFELDEAAQAIDYAVQAVAAFGAEEHAEVEITEELQAVGKSLDGFDLGTLDTVERFASIEKAGRTLSAANEAALRGAAESIQKVLASLPAAPTEQVEKETPVDNEEATPVEVEKADALVAVYDQSGNLLGAVKPNNLTPLSTGEPVDKPAPAPEADPVPAEEPTAADLEPAPADDAGEPTDAPVVPDEEQPVEKSEAEATTSDLASLVKEAVDIQVAKALEERDTVIKGLQDKITHLEGPAPSKVASYGIMPRATHLRGQGNGSVAPDEAVDLRKSLENAGSEGERNAIANQMQELANAELMRVRTQPQHR
jgi:hypothetical protein